METRPQQDYKGSNNRSVVVGKTYKHSLTKKEFTPVRAHERNVDVYVCRFVADGKIAHRNIAGQFLREQCERVQG